MRHENYNSQAHKKSQPKGYRFIAEDYSQFHLIYVSRGELVFRSKVQELALGPGGVALLRQGSRFELSTPDRGYSGVAFVASGRLPAEFRGRAEAILSSGGIRALAELMARQIAAPGPEASAVLAGLGRAMAWEALRQCESQAGLSRSPRYWADSARQALDATLYAAVSTGEALSAIPLSYRQLSRYFAAAFGMSPKRYQVHSRIAEARRLLAETRLPITTIAMELGYASSQHLATQFRAVTGHSPGKWRSRHWHRK